MGVQGLWQLLQPSGKPVSPASLEGKILAVDVSIWLHQTMKGMRDKEGNPLPNAHLQGLFSRISKLLFYRIRPVFVFDGGVPSLKNQTLAMRRERKEAANLEKGRTNEKLLQNLLKSHALKSLTGESSQSVVLPSGASAEPDMFHLPPLPDVDKGAADPLDSAAAWESDSDAGAEHFLSYQDVTDIDFDSEGFHSLPLEIQHEILTEMKEQRRENALARIAIMPEESEDFSDYQLKKLIKQSKLSGRIDSVRKEMNRKVSGDVSYAFGDDYYGEVVQAQRVVSEDAAHYILIKGLTRKQQLAEAERCKERRSKWLKDDFTKEEIDGNPPCQDNEDAPKWMLKMEDLLKKAPVDKSQIISLNSLVLPSTSASLEGGKPSLQIVDQSKKEVVGNEQFEGFVAAASPASNKRDIIIDYEDDSDNDDGDEEVENQRKKRGKALLKKSVRARLTDKGKSNINSVKKVFSENEKNETFSKELQPEAFGQTVSSSANITAVSSARDANLPDKCSKLLERDIERGPGAKTIAVMPEDDKTNRYDCLRTDADFHRNLAATGPPSPSSQLVSSHKEIFSEGKDPNFSVLTALRASDTIAHNSQEGENTHFGSVVKEEEDADMWDDFSKTRKRLLNEEEELLKAKEAKMAALLKSVEKRSQNIQKSSEEIIDCQASYKNPPSFGLRELNKDPIGISEESDSVSVKDLPSSQHSIPIKKSEKELEIIHEEMNDSVLAENHPKSQGNLILEKEILVEAVNEKMAESQAQARKSSKQQSGSGQKLFTEAEHLTVISRNDEEILSSTELPEHNPEFLEDVAKMKHKAVKRKASAKDGKHKVQKLHEESSSLGPDQVYPSLTVAYLEDVESVTEVDQEEDEIRAPSQSQQQQNQSGTEEADSSQRTFDKLSNFAEIPERECMRNEGSEDEGFIEITIDPEKGADDELFPASIFVTESSSPSQRNDELCSLTKQQSSSHQSHGNKPTQGNGGENDAQELSRGYETQNRECVAQSRVQYRTAEAGEADQRTTTGDLNGDRLVSETAERQNPSAKLGSGDKQSKAPSRRLSRELDMTLPAAPQEGKESEMVTTAATLMDDDMNNFTKGVNSLVDLYDLQRGLAAERGSLTRERGKQARLGKSVTEQINLEAQELLQLFGIPYIVSPMEAEAQCAYLELAGLTQGTITDDSDAWLFGAANVYKNFFNQGKHVEYYSADAIARKFGLDRRKMISIALLCGSDYTPGIPGVGPVRAMEVMAEFPGEGLNGLRDFREWWEDAKEGRLPRNQGKIRNKLKALQVHEGFPSHQVIEAYLHPVVEESGEAFTWGLPDLQLLTLYTKEKFGWGQQKTEEILKPMLAELTKKNSQGRINSYFHPENFLPPKPVKSKRLQAALDKFQRGGKPESQSSSESGSGSESGSDSSSDSESNSGSASESESHSEDSIPEMPKFTQKTVKTTASVTVSDSRHSVQFQKSGSPGQGRGHVPKWVRKKPGAKEIQAQNTLITKCKTSSEVGVEKVGENSSVEKCQAKPTEKKGISFAKSQVAAKSHKGRGGQVKQGASSRVAGRGSRKATARQVLLRAEVALSESSSNSDDEAGLDASKTCSAKPNRKGMLPKSTSDLKPSAVAAGMQATVRVAPNVRQVVPILPKASHQKQKIHTVVPVKAVKGMGSQAMAGFKGAMGVVDFDPRTVTLDDLGSDFSEEEGLL